MSSPYPGDPRPTWPAPRRHWPAATRRLWALVRAHLEQRHPDLSERIAQLAAIQDAQQRARLEQQAAAFAEIVAANRDLDALADLNIPPIP